ncbi:MULTISPECIES: hypothetical protein [unclassified Nocardioides]|uniref:hypothetical protein n=1 Tax=unclassified Nocardioides TaxID=2615069 RepID=UPI0030148FF8
MALRRSAIVTIATTLSAAVLAALPAQPAAAADEFANYTRCGPWHDTLASKVHVRGCIAARLKNGQLERVNLYADYANQYATTVRLMSSGTQTDNTGHTWSPPKKLLYVARNSGKLGIGFEWMTYRGATQMQGRLTTHDGNGNLIGGFNVRVTRKGNDLSWQL